ncbi:MAG: sigma-54-dependent Fis family transcriptional regulator [Deltaproteobacteria bacterium]|nr:sigma-54-dependent Fis family transcriptional regulator [Deltaproteobacteria bacterium]MBW2052669.1 sigma-54-dependent Fis family transcriptional regulator [Deltaproteobacteria bacterium]MBW2141356.1 sigma-54-dependent Fis family transcriptional regulator [Deltaproteobacteria bacterium]MBW2322745.1 sigma-54-dependent Fis family transcriptional regulator [Deltaproteobacteria bacterium]
MQSRPILVADSQPEVRTALFEALTRMGYAVALAEDGEEALQKFKADPFELIITGIRMPRLDGMQLLSQVKQQSPQTPVIVITGHGTVDNAVDAMREGAFDYILKPFSMEIIKETVVRALNSVKSSASLKTDNKTNDYTDDRRPIITEERVLKRLLDMAKSVAPAKATVLIQGESGTGKELLARFIHKHSDRASGPFVAINCASLPEGLLESELFGHEKGSFTGATARKIGKFELAHQGTILLDEISEMDPALQAKLLRVLQEEEIDRVGGKNPIAINIRVIATTNRNLMEWVKQGKFRQDLYYRLNVIPLYIPALRDRPRDICPLAEHFLRKYSRENGRKLKKLSPESLAQLKSMTWPGNVRELENIIARGVLLAKGSTIEPSDLFLDPAVYGSAETQQVKTTKNGRTMTIKEMEKELIEQALVETNGNRTHAAGILGISVRTLRNKLAEYKAMGWETGQAA